MDSQTSWGLQQFRNYVGLKFQLYNGLFMALPFHRIEKTGILLSMFLNDCEEGYNNGLSPAEIVANFFTNHTNYKTESERTDILFRFIQFVERQVVLFDALEDAAFTHVQDMNGPGTLKHLSLEVTESNNENALAKKLEDFSVKLVLTAHPTQFYPGPVLGIIHDLSRSLAENATPKVNSYLQQLGKTPFFKNQKPTPYDEALSLVWYLENVFYTSGGKIISFLKSQFPAAIHPGNPVLSMGFWPGGDRDGNPYVTADITLMVADALRGAIIKCYYNDIRKLKHRLTFKGIDVILSDLEKELYDNIFIPGQRTELTPVRIYDSLDKIRQILIGQHDGLFINLVDDLINKLYVFGLYFASLDIRQESSVHNKVLEEISNADNLLSGYPALTVADKIAFLTGNNQPLAEHTYESEIANDTVNTIKAISNIQHFNGENGCNRYIISQCNSALNVLEVYGLFVLCGWKAEEIKIDIVPLFETINDLQNASQIMRDLYSNEKYLQHLKRRSSRQTIMLGFSDGTKDGGYLMANWSIYKAKEQLTTITKEFNLDVVFFDGRGGPPARGGGKTHRFYSSIGSNISAKEIQLTIQGQTVSSNFGTINAAQYNIEQLIHAGISNELFRNKKTTMNKEQEDLFRELSVESLDAYNKLKNRPEFLDYLLHISPLRYYSDTNISSRPARRAAAGKMLLKDLRAIPFVGAWSQVKQNVTGYYGVGTALQKMETLGCLEEVKSFYQNSLFFKTLIDNCEMAMQKCFFPLTAHLSTDEKYGEIWKDIYNEYLLTEKYLLLLSGKSELMEDYPVEQLSISMRDKIVLPLVTIQQFAIDKIRQNPGDSTPMQEVYEKLIIRCSFGIINAGRNSV